MTKNQALSLRSQWLGERLRAARVKAGLTQQEAGEYLRLDLSSVSRFERGTHPIRPSYVRDLVALYGVSNPRERDELLQLNEDAWRKDWWDGDTTGLETAFLDHTWLESRAVGIRAYDSALINGLLQTEDYIRAVMQAGPGPFPPTETIERMVDLRMTRQRILSRDEPTRLSTVIEEHSLRRPIGGSSVLKGQLMHLLSLMEREHVDIRVLELAVGWHPGLEGSFAYFDMFDPYPNVVYLESPLGRTFLEEEDKVTRYERMYDVLHESALDHARSTALIRAIVKDLG